MLIQSIKNYYNKISQYKRFGGSRNENSLRRAFANLLEEYCVQHNLILIDELQLKKSPKRPDGTVKNSLQLDYGFWESKDPDDNFDEEIQKKIDIGYPTFNIIFENTIELVLYQEGTIVLRGIIENPDFLHLAITKFIEYERPEITDFRLAVEKFKQDIPDIVKALRLMISQQETNAEFVKKREHFWQVCRESINPEITAFDIREMLIQHILTSEIFDSVFDDSHFHRENNVAKELITVINTFFTGTLRRNTLASIDNYYKTIKKEAANIQSYFEKQKFLKVVYENFYKAYNPKGADKLGVIYTPNEIVKFMIESTDYLLEKHFGRSLSDKNVHILDPATGTGTFITDIIEYIPPQYLKYKYENELHCNEVSILPYYIANLNIEYIYQQKMNEYLPFNNIVFVDTLDNLGFGYIGEQIQSNLYTLSLENLARIKKQNSEDISVIIGNPPYNANQQNENENNKNRDYREIDKRIKETYIHYSTAQKSKVYDMYARFYRWATDRLNKNGIIAFVTNRSFIDSRTFDGFRKSVYKDFDFIYIVDLNGDIRLNSKQSKANVFNIMTGVAIAFFIKKENADTKLIKYHSIEYDTAQEKLDYLRLNSLRNLPVQSIVPDNLNNWIDIANTDFAKHPLLIDKQNKLAKNIKNENVLFFKYSNGVNTSRDFWAYDLNKSHLKTKIKFFFDEFNTLLNEWNYNIDKKIFSELTHNEAMKKAAVFIFDRKVNIKWSGRLFRDKFLKNRKGRFSPKKITTAFYRPFVKKYLYADYVPIDIIGQSIDFVGEGKENIMICINQSRKKFSILSSTILVDLHFNGDTVCLPLYYFDKEGNKNQNLTDWGLEQYVQHYSDANISKDAIFNYIYGVLHNPNYVEKYAVNLKREFPRIPFYNDFWKWSDWGKELLNIHLNFEAADLYPLELIEAEKPVIKPKAKLKADFKNGSITLDENTTLIGMPQQVWDYKIGTRSAVEWILDQYKEKNIQDKNVAKLFNNYKFAEYKTQVIDLIQKVVTVSINTIEILNKMKAEE